MDTLLTELGVGWLATEIVLPLLAPSLQLSTSTSALMNGITCDAYDRDENKYQISKDITK